MARKKAHPSQPASHRQRPMLWFDAAMFAAARDDGNTLHGLLMKTAQAQLGMDLAFARVGGAQKRASSALNAARWKKTQMRRVPWPDDFDVPPASGDEPLVEAHDIVMALREPRFTKGFKLRLELLVEAYSLCVFAHLFWNSVDGVRKRIVLDVLSQAWESAAEVRASTKIVRDHVAHLAERFTQGRGQRFGTPMTAEEFLATPGEFDGRFLIFGGERFDLAGLVGGVHAFTDQGVKPLIRLLAAEAYEPGS